MEGFIFGGAYLRREICVSKSIGLALWLEVVLPFLLVLLVFESKFPSTSLRELIFGGAIYQGFFALPHWGAYIWRGLYMEGLIFGILRYFITNQWGCFVCPVSYFHVVRVTICTLLQIKSGKLETENMIVLSSVN